MRTLFMQDTGGKTAGVTGGNVLGGGNFGHTMSF
jgi:hypothetical protein